MFKIPHQQASFKVLEAPDVPSALIELGYLSNAGDEKLLVSPEWQDKAADSMVDAIDAYFGKTRRRRGSAAVIANVAEKSRAVGAMAPTCGRALVFSTKPAEERRDRCRSVSRS